MEICTNHFTNIPLEKHQMECQSVPQEAMVAFDTITIKGTSQEISKRYNLKSVDGGARRKHTENGKKVEQEPKRNPISKAESKRQKILHQSSSTAALIITTSSLSPQQC
ncbi:hypothetical protein H5410_040117 [Solanum commersonii]|uniref:Uncharacterized protein n=1 Tax=Solanum commersonii TaxID=4109 RepID=A0A9J5XMZ0_SOLCO|nr:hypothetical protein H5410_040117 [Solanum commersonii]